MTIRTNDQAVRAAIDTDPDKDLSPYIVRANTLTNRVAENDVDGVLSAAILYEIETLLAAHYYSLVDPLYMSKSTTGASGVFQQRNLWDEAAQLDETGLLAQMKTGGKPKASAVWLGKRPSQQTDYVDRD